MGYTVTRSGGLALSVVSWHLIFSGEILGPRLVEIWADDRLATILDLDSALALPPGSVDRFGADRGLGDPPAWFVRRDGQSAPVPRNFLPQWTLGGTETAYLQAADPGAVFVCPIEGERLTAIAGETYRLSAYFGVHGTGGGLRLSFFDADGAVIERRKAPLAGRHIGGRRLADYEHLSLSATAPEGAASMTVEIARELPRSGENSFLFFSLPSLVRGERAAAPIPLSIAAARRAFLAPSGQLRLVSLRPFSGLIGHASRIGVVDHASGEDLCGFEPRQGDLPEIAVEGIKGAALRIRLLHLPPGAERDVQLTVDGRFAGGVRLEPEASVTRLSIPPRFLDGSAHLLQVWTPSGAAPLAQVAEILPDSGTAWTDLQDHAGPPLPIARAPAAGQRYESLADHLAEFRAAYPTLNDAAKLAWADQLAALALAHEVLVDGPGTAGADEPLSFARHDRPCISVIVIADANVATTYGCLAALRLAASCAAFEVIVVDAGPQAGARRLGKVVTGATVLRDERPLGFAASCALGAATATAPYLVFLRGDTEPAARWLDEMLYVFETFDRVGLVGMRLLDADGPQLEAGGLIDKTGALAAIGRGDSPACGHTRQTDFIPSAGVMIARAVWESTGGFDPAFADPAYAGADLALKVRAGGHRVVVAPFAPAYRRRGAAAPDPGNDPQAADRSRLRQVWDETLRTHPDPRHGHCLARDRGTAGRVVFLDIDTPRLNDNAGSYAALQEIRLIQSLGFQVSFVPGNIAYLGRHTELLQRMGVEVVHHPFVESVDDFILRRGAEFDLAYVTRYQVAAKVVPVLRRYAPGTRILVNVADLHFLREFRGWVAQGSAEAGRAEVLRLRETELAALSAADLVCSYSDIERAVLDSHLLGECRTGRLPWVVEPGPGPGFADRRDLVFVGGYAHAPNVAAVEFFIAAVMPLLCERLPGIRFRVVGTRLPPEWSALAAPDIVLDGYVPELADALNRARVFVAPLPFGAGVKGKVCDAIAAGLPSVLSPAAAEGLALRDGVEALLAETPEAWVGAIAALYEDEARWTAMSAAAIALARTAFSFEAGQARMRALLTSLGLHVPQRPTALFATRAKPVPAWQCGPRADRQHIP